MILTKTFCRCMACLLLLHACFLAVNAARANVYATNLRVKHSTNNAAIAPGSPVEISYILNEPASAGVTVQILSDTNVVNSFEFLSDDNGALRGTNSVFWDGTDTNGAPVAEGLYSISITARSDGYTEWTRTTDDANTNNYVCEPRGIAVNNNTNSPYYGRVFVGNAHSGASGKPGDNVGILKLNADGSDADEGAFTTGGYDWAGDFYSPWKIDVAADDKVYINDWNALTFGVVLAFDEELSTTPIDVIDDDNWPNNGFGDISGPAVTGGGLDTKIWMADVSTNFGQSAGIVQYSLATNYAVADNDMGVTAVTTTNSDLDMAPYDVSLDRAGHIYTIQRVDTQDNPENRLMRFPAFDGTNALSNVDWKIGASDNSLVNAYGVAANPDGTLVAVAVRGYGSNGQFQDGGTSVFDATTGELIARFSDGTNSCTDVAWDNVGNLYVTDAGESNWRAYSPPGTNQSTTISVPLIQVYSQIIPPVFTCPALNDTQDGLSFSLLGQSNVTYLVESTTDLTTWTPMATNYSSTLNERPFTFAITNCMTYFRASVVP
jgi:hypothetical protein